MTKGKPVSKRLTILSLARNLTAKQEHQIIALADRALKMERALAAIGEAVVAEGPEVSCGGYGVQSDGCYAGTLAGRVQEILDGVK